MFKAGGDNCLKSLTNIFNDILIKGKLPEAWMLSSLVPIFKEKGHPLNPNSYRGIKLLGHAFKLDKKILDGCLRGVVDIDKMQYGFISGRGTVSRSPVIESHKYFESIENSWFTFLNAGNILVFSDM